MLICLAGYAGVAFALMLAPIQGEPDTPPLASSPRKLEAFVISNGVHTELVFPVRSEAMDWRTVFPSEHFQVAMRPSSYIAIGWGDREFYLNTPRWADLTPGRALRSLLGSNRSLVHVTVLTDPAAISASRKLALSTAQYARLVRYVRETLILSGERAVHLPRAAYGRRDAFYQARGTYSAFQTCNTWVGRGLREAGVSMGAWTPFDVNVLWHLDPS